MHYNADLDSEVLGWNPGLRVSTPPNELYPWLLSWTLDAMTGQTGRPTGLMCASLTWVTLGPITRSIEGGDADQVFGVAGEILDFHHWLREEEDLHFLSLVAAVCLPVVNLLGRGHRALLDYTRL